MESLLLPEWMLHLLSLWHGGLFRQMLLDIREELLVALFTIMERSVPHHHHGEGEAEADPDAETPARAAPDAQPDADPGLSRCTSCSSSS